jgi:hypothetical protein
VKEQFCENCLSGCGRMFLAFTYTLHKKQGACVTPENITWWRTSSQNVHQKVTGAGKEANPMLSCNPGNVERNG